MQVGYPPTEWFYEGDNISGHNAAKTKTFYKRSQSNSSGSKDNFSSLPSLYSSLRPRLCCFCPSVTYNFFSLEKRQSERYVLKDTL